MPTTLENTLIRFNDGTTQSTAATTPPAASTSVAGIVQLSTATNSTSTTLAATASAVKAAYDLAANHTHSQYLGKDIGHNVVGSLCFARLANTAASDVTGGGTIAGSYLIPAGLASSAVSNSWNAYAGYMTGGGSLSGTWRCLGYAWRGFISDVTMYGATLWQRIS